MQPNLREQMLMRDQVDGVFGFVNTIRFSAKLVGIDPDKQLPLHQFRRSRHGPLLQRDHRLAQARQREARCREGPAAGDQPRPRRHLKDYDAAVESVARREPLINKAVEKERLIATLTDEMSHPEAARIGNGDVDDARFKASIAIVAEANGLARTPAPEEIFSRAFLPPMAERLTKLI